MYSLVGQRTTKPNVQRRCLFQGAAFGKAEMITKACAYGHSSLSARAICGTWPAGVMSSSRRNAPPVKRNVGLPDGRLTTPMSKEHARPQSGTERLGTRLLGGESLG